MYPMNTGYIESLTIESNLNHVIKKTTVLYANNKTHRFVGMHDLISTFVIRLFVFKFNSLNFNNLTSLCSSVDEIDRYLVTVDGISRDETNLSQFARIRLLSRDQ